MDIKATAGIKKLPKTLVDIRQLRLLYSNEIRPVQKVVNKKMRLQ